VLSMTSERPIRNTKILITVSVIIAVIAAIGIAEIVSANGGSQVLTGTNSSNDNYTGQLSATMASVHGLDLTLALNSTQIQKGQSIDVTISEQNTLNATNTVNASSLWPVTCLGIGPCGAMNDPVGFAIYAGYYTASNISSAQPLEIYAPGEYACPMILLDIASYTFEPLSSQATINTGVTASPTNFTVSVSHETAFDGSWASSNDYGDQGNFNTFAPGVYTVAAGDEWGALALLHFTVQ